jgi:Flp pilus assembly protein TadG
VLVEFAIITPLLAILMCAIIDFALAMFTLNNLTNAVRESARRVAVMRPMVADTAADRVCKALSWNPSNLTLAQCKAKVTLTTTNAQSGTPFQVTIDNYYYKPVTWVAPLFKMDSIRMRRTASFRWEYSDP